MFMLIFYGYYKWPLLLNKLSYNISYPLPVSFVFGIEKAFGVILDSFILKTQILKTGRDIEINSPIIRYKVSIFHEVLDSVCFGSP